MGMSKTVLVLLASAGLVGCGSAGADEPATRDAPERPFTPPPEQEPEGENEGEAGLQSFTVDLPTGERLEGAVDGAGKIRITRLPGRLRLLLEHRLTNLNEQFLNGES